MPISDNKTDEKLKLLRSKHEFYDVFYQDWKFYLNSYEGGSGVVTTDNLFKHARENDEDYMDRVKRAHYLNYTNVVVDFYTNYIFSDVIERDGRNNDAFYQAFIKDVNRKGDDINKFMAQVCTDVQIFGMVYILVDAPSIDQISGVDTGVVISQQFQENNGIKPYWILITPDEILDWDTDNFGNYLYIKRRQFDVSMVDGEKRKLEKYTEWYRDIIQTSVVDITNPQKPELLEFRTEVSNSIGEVPFLAPVYKKSKKYKDMGLSFICDIAYNNREILNITSLIDEFLFRQCTTASTLIECPRDLEKYPKGIPIKDLVGKEFLTYAWSIEEKRFTLKKAYDVRKTGYKKEVWRLKFEYRDEYNQLKQDYLDATPGHPILLQNDTYVALRDLKPNDKLVPFYRWVDGYPRGNRPHILQGLSPYSGIAEHRFIVRESGEELLKGHEVHHLDERHLNNEISNLKQITKKEHNKITGLANSKKKAEWWANASEKQKNYVTKKALAGIAKWRQDNPEEVKDRNKKQSISIKKTLSRLSFDERKAKVYAAHAAQGRNVEQVNHSVVSVEFLGYEDVYNMEVQDTHNYVANGIVVHNCFNILARERDSLLPMTSADDSRFGTSNVIEFSRGGSAPQYISPPAQPAEFLQAERDNIIGEIYRQAIQDLRSDLANGSKSSGFSQAQSFSRTVPFIAERADTLERTESKLMSLTMKYYFNKTWDGKIKYKDDYSVTNVSDATSHLLKLFKELALPSKTFAVLELKRLAQTLDGKIATQDLAQVFSEIESLDFKDWQEKVILQGKTSPGEKPPATTTEVSKEAKIKK